MLAALDAGAEDVRTEEETFDVVTAPEDLPAVRDALAAAGIPYLAADGDHDPQHHGPPGGQGGAADAPPDGTAGRPDDVQNVYANFDIEESVLAAYS